MLLDRPNIILLTIDTLRADMLGCYSYGRTTTSNLDRLAERGIRFEQAITGGSWTQAAFPVLLTSTYASMYGGCLGPLAPERPSPVEILAANGYATAGFSTSPLLSRTYGYDRGFDYFVDLVPDEKDPSLRQMRGGQQLLRSPLTHSLARLLGANLRPARVYVPASQLTDYVCEWLDQTRHPFFAWVHYMDVHWPYHLEQKLVRPTDIAQAWQDLAHLHAVNWNGVSMTAAQREHYIELYEQAVQYTDAQVGRLLAYLDSSRHASNTVVIAVSDHGEEFMERGYWGHVEINLYDEILKVPLIINLPGQSEGQVVQRQVRTLDIMPTVLDLCDCQTPEGIEGNSLVSLWTDGGTRYNEPLAISERWRDTSHVIAVRTEAFKYIWDSTRPDQPQLYSLRSDPAEKYNMVEQFHNEARRFQGYVEAHLRRVEQTKPVKNVSEPELQGDMIERLRALGYME